MLTCAASRVKRRGLSVGESRHKCGFHVVMRTCHGICLPSYPTLLLRPSTLCRIFLLNIRLVQIYPFETRSSSILAQPTGTTLCPLLEMFGLITAAKRSCTTRVCVFCRREGHGQAGPCLEFLKNAPRSNAAGDAPYGVMSKIWKKRGELRPDYKKFAQDRTSSDVSLPAAQASLSIGP